MTTELNLRSRVTVDNSGAVAPLQETAAASGAVGDAMRTAAAEAKTSGLSISTAVRQVAAEQARAAQQSVAAAQSAAIGRSGAEREAAQVAIMEARRAAAEQRLQAKLAADTVIAEARRRVAAEKAASQAMASEAARRRTAYVQVGQQMQDVTAQLSTGTSAAIIFAQQSGQVASALSLLGGTVGRVAGFMAGPFGAAISGAVLVLGMMIPKLMAAGDETENLGKKSKTTADLTEDLAQAYDLASASAEAMRARTLELAAARLEDERKTRDQIKAQIELASRVRAAAEASASVGGQDEQINAGLSAIFAARDEKGLGKKLDDAQKRLDTLGQTYLGAISKQFFDADRAVKSYTESLKTAEGVRARYDAAEKKIKDGFGKSIWSQDELNRQLAAAQADRDAALAKIKASEEASREANQKAERAKRKEVRETEKEVRAQKKAYDDLLESVRKTAGNTKLWSPDMVAETIEKQKKVRNSDQLSDLVRAAEKRLPQIGGDVGKRMGDEFASIALGRASQIGRDIGGPVGAVLTAVAETLDGLKGGYVRGIGGPAGQILQYGISTLARADIISRPIVAQLKKTFGDKSFAKQFGELVQTAGFGASVGSIVGGGSTASQVGGTIGAVAGKAIGNMILPGIGGAIGSVLGSIGGSLLGGLFGGTKKGSATLVLSGGATAINSSGNNGDRKKATYSTANAVLDSLSEIAGAVGGDLGNARVSVTLKKDTYYVDTSGANKTKGSTVTKTKSADEAAQMALADAIRDGGITNVSPAVQAALKKYADNVNKAVAEAVKIQSLENLLADSINPWTSVFRDFEKQAKERLRIAKDYGFSVVEIEKLNAKERADLLKQQLESATTSVRNVLKDLQFGSLAEGSSADRLKGLQSERDRLQGLVNGGDTSQIDALADIIRQQVELSKSTYGSTGQYAADRTGAVSALQQVIAQTEERINAAASGAQAPVVDQLKELNTTSDEQVAIMQRLASLIEQNLARGNTVVANALSETYARYVK